MVRRDHINCSIAQRGPEAFAVLAFADGRGAFEFGRAIGNFFGSEGQVMRASLDADSRAILFRFLNLRNGIGGREMHDIASFSAERGRDSSHVWYERLSAPAARRFETSSMGPGNSACARSGAPSFASSGKLSRRSDSLTCVNSFTPLSTRKHLNPKHPASQRA